MTRISFLSFYLILLLLPLLSCSPFEVPLLVKPGLTKLDQTDANDPKTFLLEDSFTDLQAEHQKKPNRGNVKSIFDPTKLIHTFKTVFKKPQSKTPERKVLISWEVSYEIAQKAFQSSDSPELIAKAKAVLKLGSDFDLHQYDPQFKLKDVISAINLHSISLENDSLDRSERIWSVGVLSYLRSRLPEEDRNSAHSAIPEIWTTADMGRPRAHFLLFFLQDKDLGKVVQELWSKLPSKEETSQYIIQEAIQRESIVHLITKQIRSIKLPNLPSIEFQRLFLAFINLKTPIDSKKASSLMNLIINYLSSSKPLQTTHGFDEEAYTVRLLLHLEEYHQESYLEFKMSIKTQKLQEKILQSDISLQLTDPTLSPSLRSLLENFQNTKPINEQDIPMILNILEHEQFSSAQLGKFFRVLNFIFNRNKAMYHQFDYQLNDYPELVPKLLKILTKRWYGRIDPEFFSQGSLEYRISIEDENIAAKKYRSALAEILVSKGVLSKSDTIEDSEALRGSLRQPLLTGMLYMIFKKVSEAKTFQHSEKETKSILTEYILHLLSFKMADRTLYHNLLAYKHSVPEKFPNHPTRAFGRYGQEISRFLKHKFWNHDHGQFDGFTQALPELQFKLLYLDVMIGGNHLS